MEKNKKGKIYFSRNAMMPGFVKLGWTQKTVADKEAQLSRPASYPVDFEIFSYITVSDIYKGESLIKKLLLRKGFVAPGGKDEVFEMTVEDVDRLWPEFKRTLGKLILKEMPVVVRKDVTSQCGCFKNSQIKQLKRAINIAITKRKHQFVIKNLDTMLIAKGIKLPPLNRASGTKVNLSGLEAITGIQREQFYNILNSRLEKYLCELVEKVGFCDKCRRIMPMKVAIDKPDMVVMLKQKIRELYAKNQYVKEVKTVHVKEKKFPEKRYIWRAELILTNGIRHTTDSRIYQTTFLCKQTVDDNTLKHLINPDIARLDDDLKVLEEEQILHANVCSCFGYIPESIDLKIIIGRNFDPRSFDVFRKFNQSFNEYQVLITKYFLLSDRSREAIDSKIFEIGILKSLIDRKASHEDLFAGRQDGRTLKVKLQAIFLQPVFIERIYRCAASAGQKPRYAAVVTIGNDNPRDALLQNWTEKQLKKKASVSYKRGPSS